MIVVWSKPSTTQRKVQVCQRCSQRVKTLYPVWFFPGHTEFHCETCCKEQQEAQWSKVSS